MFNKLKIWLDRRKKCPSCNGTGRDNISESNGVEFDVSCISCFGTGVRQKRSKLKCVQIKSDYDQLCFVFKKALMVAKRSENLFCHWKAIKDEPRKQEIKERYEIEKKRFEYYSSIHRKLSELYDKKYKD